MLSPKVQAYIALAVTIVASLGPVAADLAGAGLSTAAHLVSEAVAIAAALKLSVLPALSAKKGTP
jgi:hypothetical protein